MSIVERADTQIKLHTSNSAWAMYRGTDVAGGPEGQYLRCGASDLSGIDRQLRLADKDLC